MFENKSLTTATFVAGAFVLEVALRSICASPQPQNKATIAGANDARITMSMFLARFRESPANIASHRGRGAHRPASRCIYFSRPVLPLAEAGMAFDGARSGQLITSGIHPFQTNSMDAIIARQRPRSAHFLYKNR